MNRLTKRNHFSHIGGIDPNFLFSLRKTVPSFTGTNEERQARLIKGTASTLRELISDGRFESTNGRLLRNSVIFFRDAINEIEEVLFDRNYKWLCQIGERRFSRPNMERMFPLSYMQSMSLCRNMDWDLVRAQSGVAIRRISNRDAFSIGHSMGILELLLGLMKQEFPTGEIPK